MTYHIADQYGGGVAGAQITVYSLETQLPLASLISDSLGYFTIYDSLADNSYSSLLPPYPNPSPGNIVLPIFLSSESSVFVDIFDVAGKKIISFSPGILSSGLQNIIWNGKHSNGKNAPLGVYIARLRTGDHYHAVKFTKLGASSETFSPEDLSSRLNELIQSPRFQIRIAIPGESNVITDTLELYASDTTRIFTTRSLPLPFTASDDYIRVFKNGNYKPLFLKGINLGVAVPGTQPGQMAASRKQYARWIRQMAENGLNYVRTYTLHYPRFYEELAAYNLSHPEKPLFLFQGVWLDEEYEGDLFSSQTQKFDDDIEEVIDCLHGNRSISHRYGRAYGDFTTDVSLWIAGYIIGREVHPYEVALAEMSHPEMTHHDGNFYSISNASPLDTWFTARLDHLGNYEDSLYAKQFPVSVSSWPTLDPLTHPTENPDFSEEDDEILDMVNTISHANSAGFFMSYHAYPYYPDFISEDPGYQTYSDSIGPNSYLGYLADLKDHYGDIPLIVAEYGVPSSWGNAHFAFSGMHHGGFSEEEQGEINVRLLQNIYDSRFAGGFLFAWIDEWFKNSWITEPMASTASRRPVWHNVTSSEQNYGLLGFKENDPQFDRWTAVEESGKIRLLETDMDNAFFYARITLQDPLTTDDTLWIGIDSYDPDLGESQLPDGSAVTLRSEFSLAVNTSSVSPIYVTQAYDLFGIWHNSSEPEQLYHSIISDGGIWNLIKWKNNRYEYSFQEIGNLKTATDTSLYSSMDGVRIENDEIFLRLPWTLLQITDPSRRQVMNDDRGTYERETLTTDGIAFTLILGNDRLLSSRYLWDDWDAVDVLDTPEYTKKSYAPFINGIKKIPAVPGEDL